MEYLVGSASTLSGFMYGMYVNGNYNLDDRFLISLCAIDLVLIGIIMGKTIGGF